jgi:hypothetical protein
MVQISTSEGVGWIQVAQDRVERWALANIVRTSDLINSATFLNHMNDHQVLDMDSTLCS